MCCLYYAVRALHLPAPAMAFCALIVMHGRSRKKGGGAFGISRVSVVRRGINLLRPHTASTTIRGLAEESPVYTVAMSTVRHSTGRCTEVGRKAGPKYMLLFPAGRASRKRTEPVSRADGLCPCGAGRRQSRALLLRQLRTRVSGEVFRIPVRRDTIVV